MAGQVVHDQYQLGTGRYLIQDFQDPHNVRHFQPTLVFAPPRRQPRQPNIQAGVDLDEVATRFNYLIAAEAIWTDELDQERGAIEQRREKVWANMRIRRGFQQCQGCREEEFRILLGELPDGGVDRLTSAPLIERRPNAGLLGLLISRQITIQ